MSGWPTASGGSTAPRARPTLLPSKNLDEGDRAYIDKKDNRGLVIATLVVAAAVAVLAGINLAYAVDTSASVHHVRDHHEPPNDHHHEIQGTLGDVQAAIQALAASSSTGLASALSSLQLLRGQTATALAHAQASAVVLHARSSSSSSDSSSSSSDSSSSSVELSSSAEDALVARIVDAVATAVEALGFGTPKLCKFEVDVATCNALRAARPCSVFTCFEVKVNDAGAHTPACYETRNETCEQCTQPCSEAQRVEACDELEADQVCTDFTCYIPYGSAEPVCFGMRNDTCHAEHYVGVVDNVDACAAACTAPEPTAADALPATEAFTDSWSSLGRQFIRIDLPQTTTLSALCWSVLHHPNTSRDTVFVSTKGGVWQTDNWSDQMNASRAVQWRALTDDKMLSLGGIMAGGLIDTGLHYTAGNASQQPRSKYLYETSAPTSLSARAPIFRYDLDAAAWSPPNADGISPPVSPYWGSGLSTSSSLPSVFMTAHKDTLVLPTPNAPEADVVLLASYWGVLRSTDSGATWAYANTGLDISGTVNPSGPNGYLGDADETGVDDARVKPVPYVRSFTYRNTSAGVITVWAAVAYTRYPYTTSGAYRPDRPSNMLAEWSQVVQSDDLGATWAPVSTLEGDASPLHSDIRRRTLTLLRDNNYGQMIPLVVDGSNATGFVPRIGDMVMTRLTSTSAPVFRGRVIEIVADAEVAGAVHVRVEQFLSSTPMNERLRTGTSFVDFYRLSRVAVARVMYWQEQLYMLDGPMLSSVLANLYMPSSGRPTNPGVFAENINQLFLGSIVHKHRPRTGRGALAIWRLNVTSAVGGVTQSAWRDSLMTTPAVSGYTAATTVGGVIQGQLGYDDVMYAYEDADTAGARYIFCVSGVGMGVPCTSVARGAVWSTEEWFGTVRTVHVDNHFVGLIPWANGTRGIAGCTDAGVYIKFLGSNNNNAHTQANLNLNTLDVYEVTSSPMRENTTRIVAVATQDNGLLALNAETGFFSELSFGDGRTIWLSQAVPEHGILAIRGNPSIYGRRNTTSLFASLPQIILSLSAADRQNPGFLVAEVRTFLTPTPQQDPSGTLVYLWDYAAVRRLRVDTLSADNPGSGLNPMLADIEDRGIGISRLSVAQSAQSKFQYWKTHTRFPPHNFALWRGADASRCSDSDPLEFVLDHVGQLFARAPSCRRDGVVANATALASTWTHQGTVPALTSRDMFSSLVVSREGVVFAGNYNPFNAPGTNAVKASFNFGRTWVDRAAGLCNFSVFGASTAPVGCAVFHLVADPVRPHTLYAATLNGVFWTQDNGVSWRLFGTQLPISCPAVFLYIYPSGASMLAATHGRGVWQIALPGSTLPFGGVGFAYPAGPLTEWPLAYFSSLNNNSIG